MADRLARGASVRRQRDRVVGHRVGIAAGQLDRVAAVLDDVVRGAVGQTAQRRLAGLDLIGDGFAGHECVRLHHVAAVVRAQVDVVGA